MTKLETPKGFGFRSSAIGTNTAADAKAMEAPAHDLQCGSVKSVHDTAGLHLSRNLDRIHHHPLHFLCTDHRPKDDAKKMTVIQR